MKIYLEYVGLESLFSFVSSTKRERESVLTTYRKQQISQTHSWEPNVHVPLKKNCLLRRLQPLSKGF